MSPTSRRWSWRAEDITAFEKDRKIVDALADSGYAGEMRQGMARRVAAFQRHAASRPVIFARRFLKSAGDAGDRAPSVYDREFQHPDLPRSTTEEPVLCLATNRAEPGDAYRFEDTLTVLTI